MNLSDDSTGLERLYDSRILGFVLSTAPWTGGIAFLLSDAAQRRRVARLVKFLESVEERVAAIEKDGAALLDPDQVASDEFLTLFEWAVDEVTKTDDTDKLRFVRDFLVSSSLVVRPDTSVRRVFSTYVTRLSGSHLLGLVRIAEIQRGVAASDRLGSVPIPGKVPVSTESIAALFDPPSKQLARAISVDLAGVGLLVDWADLSGGMDRQRSFSLTETGRLFHRFVDSSWDPTLA